MNNADALRYCEHASCRLDTAAELAYMGARLFRRDLMRMAGEVHSSTVRCRMQPRRGPIRAPFPDLQSNQRSKP